MLRVAAIGLGWWANELAQSIHQRSNKIMIVGCYSRSAKRREMFATRYDAKPHNSYQSILNDENIEAVLLCTPHSQHAKQVEEAARSGKHVFVEKPFTLCAESGERAANVCKRADRIIAVGHNRRFSAAVQEVKRMLEAGEFGTAVHCEANFSNPRSISYDADSWRANRTESPGGGIAGMGVHMIDAMTHFFGPIVRVSAQSKRLVLKVDMDDATSALFDFKNGQTGYLATLTTCPSTTYFNLYGTKANAFADPDANRLWIKKVNEELSEVGLVQVDTLLAELEEFADACAGRLDFRIRPANAIHTVAVMQAMVRSATQEKIIHINELF